MEIPSFNELTQHIVLDGDKIKLDDLLNQPIVVTGASLMDSKFTNKGSGKCVKIQLYLESDSKQTKRVCFSGSSVIYDQIEEMQRKFQSENAPMIFRATIRKIGNYYSLT